MADQPIVDPQSNNTPDTAMNNAAASEANNEESIAPEVVLTEYFDEVLLPDDYTIVCGALDETKIKALALAGTVHVINLQTEEELAFDEEAAVTRHGMGYSHLPIGGAKDLKQVNLLAFDRILRENHGKKIAVHCDSGDRVGAVMALRAGWLRGRKMDTALERGRAHGLTSLEQEVHNRLLVPR